MTEALPEGREKNRENMEGWVRIGTGTRFRKEGGAIQPGVNPSSYPGLTGTWRCQALNTIEKRIKRGVATTTFNPMAFPCYCSTRYWRAMRLYKAVEIVSL